MLPLAKAAADRLLFDIASLRYVVTSIPEGGLDKPVSDGEWNAREILAHIAAYLDLYGGVLERIKRGEEPFPPDFSLEAFHDQTPDGGASGDSSHLPDLLTRLDDARDRLTAALGPLTAKDLKLPFRTATIGNAIQRWPMHVPAHALEIVATFPEFHIDPLILNWLLVIDFGNDEAKARQDSIRESGSTLLDDIEAAADE